MPRWISALSALIVLVALCWPADVFSAPPDEVILDDQSSVKGVVVAVTPDNIVVRVPPDDEPIVIDRQRVVLIIYSDGEVVSFSGSTSELETAVSDHSDGCSRDGSGEGKVRLIFNRKEMSKRTWVTSSCDCSSHRNLCTYDYCEYHWLTRKRDRDQDKRRISVEEDFPSGTHSMRIFRYYCVKIPGAEFSSYVCTDLAAWPREAFYRSYENRFDISAKPERRRIDEFERLMDVLEIQVPVKSGKTTVIIVGRLSDRDELVLLDMFHE